MIDKGSTFHAGFGSLTGNQQIEGQFELHCHLWHVFYSYISFLMPITFQSVLGLFYVPLALVGLPYNLQDRKEQGKRKDKTPITGRKYLEGGGGKGGFMCMIE